MGKGGKAQTVGYKYYLGMHQILCHGPIDAISKITVDDRLAWEGYNTGGASVVSKPDLFGGDGREGGVSGTIDIEMGGPAQTQNDYLVARLGSLIPAYRGVVGAVFRQCYLGNNPYLKPWRFRGQRIHVRQNTGIAQWYPTTAPIGALTGEHAIYIMLDKSGSMATVASNGQTRMANAKVAIIGLLDFIEQFVGVGSVSIDIGIVGWSDTTTSMTRRDCDAADLAALKTFVAGIAIGGGTDFRDGVAGANTFFTGAPVGARRTAAFVTDGEPAVTGGVPAPADIASAAGATLFAISGVTSYAFNIDLEDTTYTDDMDNSPIDGVPVIEGSDSNALLASLIGVLSGAVDLNPIHIIRECLTDPDWGMGYTDGDVDDDTFEDCANKIVIEALGMSVLWDKQIKLEEFIDEVKKHIDAVVYVSRQTGKFICKLIRNDYDPDDLIHLDESNIARIEDPRRASFGELINSVTVNYWDNKTGKDASLTITDTAMVQLQGAVINTTLQYPGFTSARNATIVGQRDLKALSSPGLSCTVYANSDADSLNPGDVFKMSWSRWGLSNIVMRVTGIAYGTGRSNQVRINCVQDAYDTNTSVVIEVPDNQWENPSSPPGAADDQMAGEAPYYELVQVLGESTAISTLGAKPDVGFVFAVSSRAPNAISARVWTDDGAGYQNVGSLDFAPTAELLAPITKVQTAFTLTQMEDLDEVVLGSFAQIGDELVRVDSIDTVTGDITVGRGILDTVPAEHLAGDVVYFWDNAAGFDPTEYVLGEEVDVKVLPFSGAGALDISAATPMTVELDQRAYRPYAPGDLRINGLSYDSVTPYSGELTVSWKHRDRLQSTGGTLVDHTADNIGPEAGTTYRLRGYLGAVLTDTVDDIAGNTYDWTPSTEGVWTVEIHAKRDGVYSWQAPSTTFDYGSDGLLLSSHDELAVNDLFLLSGDATDGNDRLLFSGDEA